MNCSSIKNTLALYRNEIIIVGLQFEEICLLNVKNKEIIYKIKGIDIKYIFVRNCGDIIIKENLSTNIYKFENGEILFKGILKKILQVDINNIIENEKGELFISENNKGFINNSSIISQLYIYKE